MFEKFETPKAANDNESGSVEQNENMAAIKAAAEKLLAEIDPSLEGQERHNAIVALMEKLGEADAQQNYEVIEYLAEVLSIEQPLSQAAAKILRYPTAATTARVPEALKLAA